MSATDILEAEERVGEEFDDICIRAYYVYSVKENTESVTCRFCWILFDLDLA